MAMNENVDHLANLILQGHDIMNETMSLSIGRARLMKPGEQYISILIRKEEHKKALRIDFDTPNEPGRSCMVAEFDNRTEAIAWLINQLQEKVIEL